MCEVLTEWLPAFLAALFGARHVWATWVEADMRREIAELRTALEAQEKEACSDR